MTIAVSMAVGARRARRRLRVDWEHGGLGGRLRRPCGPARARAPACGRGSARQARPGARARSARARGARFVRRGARRGARAGGARDARPRQLAQPAPARRAEDGRLRNRRGARRHRPTSWRCPTAAAATRARTRSASRRRAPDCRGSSPCRRPNGRRPPPRRSASPSPFTRPRSRTRSRARRRTSSPSTDDAILEAWRLLAHEEGVFCEPASAAGVAGLAPRRPRARARGVVCVVTGHGLKDPEAAARLSPPPVAGRSGPGRDRRRVA